MVQISVTKMFFFHFHFYGAIPVEYPARPSTFHNQQHYYLWLVSEEDFEGN